MTDTKGYVRGAFAVFPPRGTIKQGKLIPFRFNPESLNRSLQIEQAQQNQNNEGAGRRAGGSNTEQLGDAADGPLKHSFNIMIRVDLLDREEGKAAVDQETLSLGVLPEIAALEQLMYPAEETQADRSTEATAQRPPRPSVLLVWGLHRVFPVRVVSMTINETMHNADLAPTRAEIEVGLEISREDGIGAGAIKDARDYMNGQRTQHAQRFYARVSAQGDKTTPITNDASQEKPTAPLGIALVRGV